MRLGQKVSQWIRYAQARVLSPQWRDYADMGIGIEARYERCRPWWDRHLALTRSFVRTHLEKQSPASTLHLLGAGRLLDVDLELAQSKATQVILYDADPTAPRFWPRHGTVRGEVIDLTGVIESWTTSVEKFLHSTNPSIPALANHLKSLPPLDPPISIGEEDMVLSLNLLSQLPLYWTERFGTMVERVWRFRRDDRGKFQDDIQSALDRSCAHIQAHHLKMCGKSRHAIVITDEKFFYYRQDSAPWQVEEALYVDAREIPGMREVEKDSWLWHIAPQGIESDEYGEIHQVVARFFQR